MLNQQVLTCVSPPPPKQGFVFPQVQIDPYLEDSMCQVCLRQPGPFFCRDQVSGNLLDEILLPVGLMVGVRRSVQYFLPRTRFRDSLVFLLPGE